MISEKTLFIREFIKGLISQTYPKEKIILHVCCEYKTNIHKIDIEFNDFTIQYKKIVTTTIRDYDFASIKSSASKFVLFLHSSIVLTQTTTFEELVAQDLDVVGPKIQTAIPKEFNFRPQFSRVKVKV